MARSIRRGSSRIRSCGSPTPRIRLRRRSSRPPKKSMTSPVSRPFSVRKKTIRLLIVKSRRAASSRASTPSVRTSNWRCPGPVEYSARASATSISSANQEVDTLYTANRFPAVTTRRIPSSLRGSPRTISPSASNPIPVTIRSTSLPGCPSMRSRTIPPTRYGDPFASSATRQNSRRNRQSFFLFRRARSTRREISFGTGIVSAGLMRWGLPLPATLP